MNGRVLHLIEKCPDYQSETGAGQIQNDRGGAFEIVTRTLGRGGDYSTAPRAVMWLRRQRLDAQFIHAWGERALAVAVLSCSHRIVYSPVRFPTRRAIRWLRAAMTARRIDIVCPTDTMRRAFVTRGVPIERCHLIRPGVDFSKIRRRRDPRLRRALGLADDDFVLLAPGDSTRAAGHDLSAWAAAILHVLDPKYRLLLWGRGDAVDRVRRFAVKTGQPEATVVAVGTLPGPVEFEALLAATDLVLITPRAPSLTLAIATCMAAGLPIVGVVTETVSELLEDRHTALMVGKLSPRMLAQRVLDVRRDPSVQWSIADMARTEAYEYFSMMRYLAQWRAVYGQVANDQPVQVPAQAPGAGLRFHGRA
jgi:glycosyltransferase involved in cell wall biosynthesis